MRQITIDAIAALQAREPFNRSNTSVVPLKDEGFTSLYLHGNEIIRLADDGALYITDAGWATLTTKERLNGLPNVHIQQKNYLWYLNGEQWDGAWIRVD